MAVKNRPTTLVQPGTVPGKLNTMTIAPGGVPQPNLGSGVPTGSLSPGSTLPQLQICPYKCVTIALDNAFTNFEVDFLGSVLWAMYSTGPSVVVYVRFEQPSNDPVPFYAPAKIGGFPFTKIYITNATAQSGQTITFFASLDKNASTLENEVG